MVAVPSTMLAIGTKAPEFTLPDPSEKQFSLESLTGAKGYCIMFMCNHCPFVKHIQKKLTEVTQEYQGKGIEFIAISSNDVDRYPEDSPERMGIEAAQAGYVFPYLYDKTQEVAKLYHAACTPDFYLFDKDKKLVYRGQFDKSRPNNGLAATGEDLKKALDATLAGENVPEEEQLPSIGCNIKWKPGNAPEYFIG